MSFKAIRENKILTKNSEFTIMTHQDTEDPLHPGTQFLLTDVNIVDFQTHISRANTVGYCVA